MSDASGDAIRGDGDLTARVDGEIAIRGGGSRSAARICEAEGGWGSPSVGVGVGGGDGGDDGVSYLPFCVAEGLVQHDDGSVVIDVGDVESDVDGITEVGSVGGGLNGVGEGVRAGLEIVLSDASGDAIRGDGDLTAGVDGEIAIRGGGSRSAA